MPSSLRLYNFKAILQNYLELQTVPKGAFGYPPKPSGTHARKRNEGRKPAYASFPTLFFSLSLLQLVLRRRHPASSRNLCHAFPRLNTSGVCCGSSGTRRQVLFHPPRVQWYCSYPGGSVSLCSSHALPSSRMKNSQSKPFSSSPY